MIPKQTTCLRWLASLILLLTATMMASAQLPVLLLASQDNAGRERAKALRALLEDSGRFTVRVCETPVGLTPETFAAFDLLVVDELGADLGSASRKSIEKFVASGKGLLLTHHALTSLSGAEHPVKFLGLSVGAVSNSFEVFALKLNATSHPVCQGLTNEWQTGDHRLGNLRAAGEFETLASTATGEPLLLAGKHGAGRICATALGHDGGAMLEPVFIHTFLRGAEWAASGKVTLPADLKVPVIKLGAPRVVVLAGGHDHDAMFYSLFDDVREFGWVQVSDLKWSLQADLRPKCDVLVMYDFTRELDDKQKAQLRSFVESGKGVVVLHHGILNFQNWPWWYEEVVGGRYRLQNEGGIPNSTVKMGQQHWITPLPGHPITAGIEPFRVVDETYKGLFIATNVTPFLVTDSATSDRAVGWIGPCQTSRVVFIQLGHDHSSLRHPSYRQLVRNSVLWAAGKLN